MTFGPEAETNSKHEYNNDRNKTPTFRSQNRVPYEPVSVIWWSFDIARPPRPETATGSGGATFTGQHVVAVIFLKWKL